MKPAIPAPALQTAQFHPGMRVAVACSGGADSVALLRTLLDRRNELGLVLSVAHMHHGIRGVEADGDAAYVEALANQFNLPFHLRRVDVPATAETARQGLEETARSLRYAWFWELLTDGQADAVATAHTLDDQAETVLHRLLRGAWTEGLGGIFPTLQAPPRGSAANTNGVILRPFLAISRSEIEEFLGAIGQPWREDSTNRDTTYTRNRLRHELLPALADYNPAIRSQLAQIATLARDDEAYWDAELARLLPSLLLPGKAVRGGGRATNTLPGVDSLAIEIERLRALHPALRRRVIRAAAGRLGVSLDFADTERLLALCGLVEPDRKTSPSPNRKLQMEQGLRAERTPRELRLSRVTPEEDSHSTLPDVEYVLPVPGQVEAAAFGLRLEATLQIQPDASLPQATLRLSRAGDRVILPHSRSPLKIREALQRSRKPSATGSPVLEWQGEIVWMPGIAVDSRVAKKFGLAIASLSLESTDSA